MWPAYRGQFTGRWASPMKGITCSNDKAPLRERERDGAKDVD